MTSICRSSSAACICCRNSARPGASSRPTVLRSRRRSTSNSSDDRAETVARGTGIGVAGFAEALPKLAPDLLVVLGDRYEILSAAVAATLLNIPIAHIHGGEVTAGAFDDAIRHAITKMACVHFTAAEPYRRRVIQMGENPDFVFNVGAPGLDLAATAPAMSRSDLFKVTRHQWSGTVPARHAASDHRAAGCRCRQCRGAAGRAGADRGPQLYLHRRQRRSRIPGDRRRHQGLRRGAARPGAFVRFARQRALLGGAAACRRRGRQFVERHSGGACGRGSLGQYRRPPARPAARGIDHRLPRRPERLFSQPSAASSRAGSSRTCPANRPTAAAAHRRRLLEPFERSTSRTLFRSAFGICRRPRPDEPS